MRTVLVTGATGAIGSVLAKRLIDEPDTGIGLLIRARSAEHLTERLHQLYAFWEIDRSDPRLARVQAIAGDVTVAGLGLPAEAYNRLSREVTHVVHSAGNVKLNQPPAEATRSAVDSARHIVTLANACRESGQFQKLDFVSTVGVAGRMDGVVPERPLTGPRTFRNSYEAAKAEAEDWLLEQISNGLPATIHRPSMVVGDSHTGRIIQFQVFYHLSEFLSGKRTRGLIPDTGDIRLDIVPVDYVARAILASSATCAANARIFHLCAGPTEAPRIHDLADRIHRVFESRGERLPPLRRVSLTMVRATVHVLSRVTTGRRRKALRSLPLFLAYLDEVQTFENTETAAFFSQFGLAAPTVDSYLDTIVSYYLNQRIAQRG